MIWLTWNRKMTWKELGGFVLGAGKVLVVLICIIMDLKSGQQTKSPNPAKAWAEYPDTIIQAANRLKGVQIENLSALEIIKRYNTSDVFIYADPPYLHSTRKNYL